VVGLAALLAAAPWVAASTFPTTQDTSRKAPASTAKPPFQEFLDSVRTADSVQALKRASIVPPECPVGEELRADSAVMRACREAWAQYFAYQRFGLAHREGVFRWQLLSSEITFVVVVSLVFAGVFFSWLQFKAELPRPRPLGRGKARIEERVTSESGGGDTQEQEVVVRTQSAHQLKAGTGGIEVSSPVLGVIILTLSLLFFYLYLKFVYPIHETF
jgi:hypothetical protein